MLEVDITIKGPNEITTHLEKVVDLLPLDVMQNIRQVQEELRCLINGEVSGVYNELIGDWDYGNYFQCLYYGPGDREYESFYKDVISGPKIQNVLFQLDTIFKDLDEVWKKVWINKFTRENFQDLIYYEISKNYNKLKHDELKVFNNLNRESVPGLIERFKNSSNLKSVCLGNNDFSSFDEERLKIIFENSRSWIRVELYENYFHRLDKVQSEAIFEYSHNWKIVNFQSNHLGSLDRENLEIIFRHSKDWKVVTLHNNNLGSLDSEKLEILFRYSQNWMGVELGRNWFGSFKKESIELIFKHSKNWKSVYYYEDSIGSLDKESLQVMFKYSKDWRRVGLDKNNLGSLDKESLEIIFKYSQNWRIVDLADNGFSNEQKELIGNLLPDSIKIEFN